MFIQKQTIKIKAMGDNKNTSGGIGFCGLLTIAFIVLKLCAVIDWNWWWVLSPIWVPGGIFIVFLLIAIIVSLRQHTDTKKRIESGMNEWAWKRRKKKNKPDSIEAPPPKSKWQQRMEEMQKNRQQH